MIYDVIDTATGRLYDDIPTDAQQQVYDAIGKLSDVATDICKAEHTGGADAATWERWHAAHDEVLRLQNRA